MRICKGLGLSPADSARWISNCAIHNIWRISRPKKKQFWIEEGGSVGPISHKVGVSDRLMTFSLDPTSDKCSGSRLSVQKAGALSCNELRRKCGPILYAFVGAVSWVRGFWSCYRCVADPRWGVALLGPYML